MVRGSKRRVSSTGAVIALKMPRLGRFEDYPVTIDGRFVGLFHRKAAGEFRVCPGVHTVGLTMSWPVQSPELKVGCEQGSKNTLLVGKAAGSQFPWKQAVPMLSSILLCLLWALVWPDPLPFRLLDSVAHSWCERGILFRVLVADNPLPTQLLEHL